MECPKRCKFGRKCLSKLTIGQLFTLRQLFWGSKFEDAPKTKERRQKQTELLFDAFERRTDSFHFRVPFNENDGYVDVCESAYVVALGRHGNMETNQITKV